MMTKKYRYIIAITSLFLLASIYFYSIQVPDMEAVRNDQTPVSQLPYSTHNDIKNNISTDDLSGAPKPKTLIKEVSYDDYTSTYGPLPKSLRGTRIPAAFSLDPDGHLIITPSIKSVIEYFLSGTGEESIEIIIARIEEFITNQLEEPARSEALDVLAQYIGYKEALIGLESDLAENNQLSGQTSDYLTMFQYRREARMNNLSPEVYDAFFADEDKADSYTASLLEIGKNSDLTDEEKAEQYLAAEHLLPVNEQKVKKAERARETLQLTIESARKEGANEAEIFQMRADVYGHEAAERFAKADRKKADWNARFEQYRYLRQQILENEGLSNTDKKNEIETLQQTEFSQSERRRLATLDQLADKKAPL